MRIQTCYSTDRTESGIMRTLDGDRRTLILLCTWGELPIHTYLAVRDQLTDEEITEVRKAFGWDSQVRT